MDDILGKSKQQEAEWRLSMRQKAAELAGQNFTPKFTANQFEIEKAYLECNPDNGGMSYVSTSEGRFLAGQRQLADWHAKCKGEYGAPQSERWITVTDYTAPALPPGSVGACEEGHEKFLGKENKFYISRCDHPGCKSFVRAGAALTSKQEPEKKSKATQTTADASPF